MYIRGKIENLRIKLHKAIEKYGLNSEQTQKISKELDELINYFNKQQRLFPDNSKTSKEYNLSIEKLKQLTIDFNEFPTVESWNYYARSNKLLSSETLKYISGLNWHELREKILFEIYQKKFKKFFLQSINTLQIFLSKMGLHYLKKCIMIEETKKRDNLIGLKLSL